MLVICPTADYEIYLGRNLVPVDQVLFQPTNKILKVWEDFEIKATIFPDICSVWRHRELGMTDYVSRFENQILEVARRGHDVQLHLHPEWRTAVHENSHWRFAPRTGSLHDLGFDPEDPQGAPALIREARQYLHSLLEPVVPGYQCIAFRAGGWILQPEEELIRALLHNGIRVDATVIPGMRLLRTDYRVDFTAVPDAPNWTMSSETGIARDSGNPSDLLEIPIASYRGLFPIWQHVLNEARLRKRARLHPQPHRGYPMVKVGPKYGMIERTRRKFSKLNVPRMFDIADTCESMLTTVDSYLRKYDCRSQTFMVCMNGHPKDTYDHHLIELNRFFDRMKSHYSSRVRFESISDYLANLPSRAHAAPTT